MSCARLGELRNRGEAALRNDGPLIDESLVAELEVPGTDRRFGVSLVARLPPEVTAEIEAMQGRLARLEPEQYYYPASDLHLTLLEIRSQRPREEAEEIAGLVLEVLDAAADCPLPALAGPVVLFDRRAGALNFAVGRADLVRAREVLVGELARHGVAADSRHPLAAAHVTFFRYLKPLRVSVDRWVAELKSLVPCPLRWKIPRYWLTWGPTWYGMDSRLSRSGPFELRRAPS